MNGIVGYVGRRKARGVLADSLRGMDAGGADPFGWVILNGRGFEVGGPAALRTFLRKGPRDGRIGLGLRGERPHVSCDGRFAVVVAGSLRNRAPLRRSLRGHRFRTKDPGEVVVHLIEEAYRKLGFRHPLRAVTRVVERLRGRLAAGIVCADYPDLLLAASVGRTLLLGMGRNGNLLAGGAAALAPHVRRAARLRSGEVAKLDPKGVAIFDRKFRRRAPRPRPLAARRSGFVRRNRREGTTR